MLPFLFPAGKLPRKTPVKNGPVFGDQSNQSNLGRRIASSTLRRSLAWLLKDSLGSEIGRNAAGKAIMSRENEHRLTEWMGDHAAISFLCHGQAWHIEDHLIADGPALPLNLKGSAHAFRQQLSALRAMA